MPYPQSLRNLERWMGQSMLGIIGAGKTYFVDPANGSDGNTGLTPQSAFDTLGAAHSACTAGKNDTVVLIGDGGTTGTARLSAGLTWSKNATHLIGVSAPTGLFQRSRIAPTAAVAAFANLVTVTGSGCIFKNVSAFHGFDTGGASQVCWRDTGSRNYYENMHFCGMGDQASADDAGSRSLLLEGAESTFRECTIGTDTVTRGAANASVEFKTTSCKRHTFIDCMFPFHLDAGTPLGIKVATAAHSDRWQRFVRCAFVNTTGSGSTTMTALATLAASIGGFIILDNCYRIGITDWGTDATSNGQLLVTGPAVGATDDVGRAAVAIAS